MPSKAFTISPWVALGKTLGWRPAQPTTTWKHRPLRRAADYTGCRMKVMVALGGHWYLTNLPRSQTRKNVWRSWRLRTTTAILPSELRAAVAMKSSLVEVETMRLAPGRMKRENW